MAGPILVTGGTGQLASSLKAAGGDAIRVAGRPALDFDRPESIVASFREVAPTLVVNAAAYTAVDAAEDDAEAAYRANRDGPGALARLCAAAGVPLIHISTDYVFDGAKGAPYVETDPTAPTGVYGASKLAGEHEVLAAWARTVVLRTSWVYAPTGKNFVRTMLRVGADRDRLRVVADQRGCPTTAADLADAILAISARLREGWRDEYAGVFHAAGSGETTWHGLAVATFEEAARFGAHVPVVEAITAAEYPTKAKRPADSRLDCGKLASVFGVRLPDWRASLARTIDAVFAGK
ncbi:MAG TPA: dTDP-4-dehydrorhamnose reductase [Acetobacteraceae bacterium]|jgi:dTDP-4-dehydrorhamnose reductase|nr:dTDP-4-dehydrorhamnose reductase [Acetobacteraceae bacterium]